MTKYNMDWIIEKAERILANASIWSPHEDAEVLLAHVLGISQTDLSSKILLDPEQKNAFFQLVKSRASRIPLAYIIGRETFGGIEVSVGPGVFVPRMHTEPMLAWGLEHLCNKDQPLVVDLCTGSGAIALAIAHVRPDAIVHAMEKEQTAMSYACRNAEKCAATGDTPIQLHLGDVTDSSVFAELTGKVDLVLANPPFVPEGTKLLPEWEVHQPYQAIYSENDGTRVIRCIVDLAVRLLRSGGGVAIEHDDSQVKLVTNLLQVNNVFTEIETGLDHHGSPRFTTAIKNKERS